MSTASVRFNSPEYLEQWKATGAWPVIHNAMADFAASHMRGESLLDLGCSYGLLGARIAEEAGGMRCAGIDADEKVIEAAQSAGVVMRFFQMKITREKLPDLAEIIHEVEATVIIARRVLPELWGEDQLGGAHFAITLAEAGVREIFLEGRVASERATNPLRSIGDEVRLLSERYREVHRSKALSYLVLR